VGNNEHDETSLQARRPPISRWLIAVGMALFYAHSTALMLFMGWSDQGWEADWASVHTLVLILTASMALLTLSRAGATRSRLSRIAYGLGVATALTPLFVYAPHFEAHSWGAVTAIAWSVAALLLALVPAWVMRGLMGLEKNYQLEPSPVRLWDVIGGCLACIPLSGLPLWLLHRGMYPDRPWLEVRRFQVDLWLEVSVGALLVAWAFVAMVLRDREELPP